MHSSRNQLLETLDKIRETPMLVVGDLMLDRYIWGVVERISPEAPVPVVEVRRIEERLGGAGNVALNLRSVGAKVSICALIGDDPEGRTLLHFLEAGGIEKDAVMLDRNRPSTLKTRIMSQSQQMLRIDRESRESQTAALGEGFATVVDAHIDASKGIIISDYGKGVISEAVLKRFQSAADLKRIGTGIRPLMLDPHPRNYGLYRNISIAKPNRKEAEAASGVRIRTREDALEAARILIKKWSAEMMLISLGEDGLVIVSSASPDGIFFETAAVEVYDVSGAGDTVTALFTAALASGADTKVAGDLANIGAGIVVSEVGTIAVDPVRLRAEIEKL